MIDFPYARALVCGARQAVDNYRDASVGEEERAAGIHLAAVAEELARLTELALDAAIKADGEQ